jgi:serine protease Do
MPVHPARRAIAVALFCLAAGCSAGPAGARQPALTDLFEEVHGSVVVLTTVQRQAAPGSPSGEVTFSGLGSGVVIDGDGYIITAAHVVQTADLVEVEFQSGERATAAVISSDPSSDLAMVKVDRMPAGIRPLPLGDSDRVRIGEQVFVVGAPYGLDGTLTVGHISARHSGDDSDSLGLTGPDVELFQTDAAINQGNSGGPMFDMQGNVIGIVSHILSQSGGFEGLGFVVSSNTVRERMLERRSFWSGITTVRLYGPVAAALNVPQAEALLVQNVAAGSPGMKMGLRPSQFPVEIGGQTILIGGDIILSVGGIEYSTANRAAIGIAIDALAERESLKLRVLRGGRIVQIDFFGFYRQGGG